MPTVRRSRCLVAPAAALAGLALTPAVAGAALSTFGSDLTAPADVSLARQADTAYWQTKFADGRTPTSPASGQIRSIRVKGIALSNPVAGVPGGETMFHLQALRLQADGTYLVLRSSQALFMPPRGADPQAITTFEPINFCIETGDVLVFNTVGGWDGVVTQTGPYPLGTPLQIFSRNPNAVVSEFEGADKTNNGDILTASTSRGTAGLELLMQMTLGTGPDATPLCPGGTMGQPGAPGGPPAPPPPPPPRLQIATLPAKQRVTVSKAGKLSVSVFCLPGTSRCVGKVRIRTTGSNTKQIGSGSFDVAQKSTGHTTIFLTKTGRRRFAAGRGRLTVNIAAETNPGGASRRSTLRTTLRRRGS